MSTFFGQLFARGCERTAVIDALAVVMRREGCAPFDPAMIPARYPAQKREFSHIAVAGPDTAGTITILMEDWDAVFARAMALAKALPGAMLVAVVMPPLDHVRCKAYRGGDLVLKVGDDPDHELFFNPLKADVQAVAVFVAAWRGEPAPLLPDLSERDGTPTARPADLLGPLGLTRVDCRFDDAIAGHWPAPLNPMLFIDRRSRLFLER